MSWQVGDRVVQRKEQDRPGTIREVEYNELSVMVEWDDAPGELDFQWHNRIVPHEVTFTLKEVLRVLRNLGHDIECGACMEGAFTGASGHDHTCGKEAPELVIEAGEAV